MTPSTAPAIGQTAAVYNGPTGRERFFGRIIAKGEKGQWKNGYWKVANLRKAGHIEWIHESCLACTSAA